RQMPRHTKHRRTTGSRHYQDGIVLERLLAVERMRGEPTPGLPERLSQPSKRAARRRGREPGLMKGKASAGRKWCKARGGGWEGRTKRTSIALTQRNLRR